MELPFGTLSDGYRAYLGLVADLIYHLQMNCPHGGNLTDMTGIVLVDDIDLHLHPKWQRTVVPHLAGTFPRLQFILTTHSPLVTGTLHADNVPLGVDVVVRLLLVLPLLLGLLWRLVDVVLGLLSGPSRKSMPLSA